jgi:hypothetical protein
MANGASSTGARRAVAELHGRAPSRGLRAHLENAGAGFLPHDSRWPQTLGEQHRMRGDRGMADEGGLLARIEETQPDVMVGRIRRQHEGGLRVREFARDGLQLRIPGSVGAEHDAGRIAGERHISEGVDLKYLHERIFACTRPCRYTGATLGWSVVDLRCGDDREPVEPDPVSTGVGSRCHVVLSILHCFLRCRHPATGRARACGRR